MREMQLEGIQNLETRGELGHVDGLKRYRGSVEVSKGKKKKKKSDIKLGTGIIVNQWLILVINGL